MDGLKSNNGCVHVFEYYAIISCLEVLVFPQGMGIIEQLDPISFSNYLKKYHNTICGRHPIGVLLNVSISPRDGYISADLLCNSNYRKGIITSLGGIHLPFNVSDLIFDMFGLFLFCFSGCG